MLRRIGSLPALLLFPLTLVLSAAGCGGSSSTAGSSGAVSVTIASTPIAPASLAASATAMAAGGEGNLVTDVDHVWVTVTGFALVPGASSPAPDFEAATEGGGSSGGGLVRADVAPRTLDLLHLSGDAGAGALLLDAFPSVPAGTYGKIRIYYSNATFHSVGAADNTALHATANGHLDLHFVGGDLVVPVATDPPAIRPHNVTIAFVLGRDGLMITRAGNSGNYNMRPQAFATVGDLQYVVSGVVSAFDDNAATFDLTTSGAAARMFPVAWSAGTSWFFREGAGWAPVSPTLGIAAMRDGATVDVLGEFAAAAPDVLRADTILIAFPARVDGTVTAGFRPDDTFLVFDGTDNVTIRPSPDRASARYGGLGAGAIAPGVAAIARGYGNIDNSVSAYWITVGP
jgi:hypothetical protein